MKKLLLSVATGILTLGVGFAQSSFVKGYIITISGDTVKGEVKYNPKNELGLFDGVTFQTSASDKKSYHANKVKEFGFDNKVFVARKLDDKPVFFKRLSGGAANLYEHKTEQFFMNSTRVYTDYYVDKGKDTELVKIKESKFKKQLAEVMSDDAKVVRDLNDKKYEFDRMVDIFELYNSAKNNRNGNG